MVQFYVKSNIIKKNNETGILRFFKSVPCSYTKSFRNEYVNYFFGKIACCRGVLEFSKELSVNNFKTFTVIF